MNLSFNDYLATCQQRIEHALQARLDALQPTFTCPDNQPDRLQQAIRYSLLGGGKRIRPLLVYSAFAALNNPTHDNDQQLDDIACAIEMIHSYSLIHDDLPAMDDDQLRRGKPTCHCAFDEATAILAGDALQAQAFACLAEMINCPATTQVQLIKLLAQAVGVGGMVGGQAMDIDLVGKTVDLLQLETLHQLKTGALIRAAVAMSATLANASNAQYRALDRYAVALGLAFQVQDDILDANGDTALLGKHTGADQRLNKPSYAQLLGIEGAQQKAQALQQQALQALVEFSDKAQPLRDLAVYIVSRQQ